MQCGNIDVFVSDRKTNGIVNTYSQTIVRHICINGNGTGVVSNILTLCVFALALRVNLVGAGPLSVCKSPRKTKKTVTGKGMIGKKERKKEERLVSLQHGKSNSINEETSKAGLICSLSPHVQMLLTHTILLI